MFLFFIKFKFNNCYQSLLILPFLTFNYYVFLIMTFFLKNEQSILLFKIKKKRNYKIITIIIIINIIYIILDKIKFNPILLLVNTNINNNNNIKDNNIIIIIIFIF